MIAIPDLAVVAQEAAAFADGAAGLLANVAKGLLGHNVLATLSVCAVVVAVNFVRDGFRVVWRRKIVEGGVATIVILVANHVFAPLIVLLARGFDAAYAALAAPRIDPAVWQDVPGWAMVPIAVLAYDVANYWNHRAMHMRWLWPVHAVHHSETSISALTTLRIHGLEAFVMAASYTALLSWLGFPPDALGGAAVVLTLLNAYVHVDVDWGHGPFRHLIASPRFHRWHHADAPEAHGKNLANVFPFLDVLFGTYYVPGRCDAPLGAAGVPENDVAKLMLFPFAAWARMAGQALGRRRHEAAARG